MSSLWNLGVSIIGASAEVVSDSASGIRNVVRNSTSKVMSTTADAVSGSFRRVSSKVSSYLPTRKFTSAARFACSSTYYVSNNTIRAVQLVPNFIELCKTKETRQITLYGFRTVEKALALVKSEEVSEIAKELVKLARSETTSQILVEIKDLLLEFFALLNTSEADAFKAQLSDLVEGLQGIAREQKAKERAHPDDDDDDAKEEVIEEPNNQPGNQPKFNIFENFGIPLDENERKLISGVVWRAPNLDTVVKWLALMDLSAAQATELWNQRQALEKHTSRNPRQQRLGTGELFYENSASTPQPSCRTAIFNEHGTGKFA